MIASRLLLGRSAFGRSAFGRSAFGRSALSRSALSRTALGFFACCAMLAAAPSLIAQQFQDQSVARLPDSNEYTSQVSVADIDGDGDLDIAFANGRGFGSPQLQERVRLMINNGTGTFTDESVARLGGLQGYGRDVEFGDVDGDGDLDMAVANDFNTAQRLMINNGAGVFADETVARIGVLAISSSHCSFGDVDDDGDLDLWFTRGGTSRFGSGVPQLLINDGTGVFTNETTTRVPPALLSEPMDCIFGDLDGDFDLDVLAGNRSSNTSRVYYNDGAGNFTSINLPPNSSTYSFDLGDLDNDGDLDIFGANSQAGSSREAIFINNGSGTFSDQTNALIPLASNPNNDDNDSKFFDYDNDGDLDVIIAALGGGTERILRNNSGTSFTLVPGVITAVSDSSLDIEVADFTGDGRLDVVTAQGESGAFRNRLYINVTGTVDNLAPSFPQTQQLADTADTIGPYVVRAVIRDQMTSDTGAFYTQTLLRYSVNAGTTIDLPMTWVGNDMYRAEIPGQPGGSSVDYSIRAIDFAGNAGDSTTLNFMVLGPPESFRRGDCNQDTNFDLADAIAELETLFAGGAPFACEDACDVNDSGVIDISDPISVLSTLFSGGAPPPAPGSGPGCGPDPTGDALDCATQPTCP